MNLDPCSQAKARKDMDKLDETRNYEVVDWQNVRNCLVSLLHRYFDDVSDDDVQEAVQVSLQGFMRRYDYFIESVEKRYDALAYDTVNMYKRHKGQVWYKRGQMAGLLNQNHDSDETGSSDDDGVRGGDVQYSDLFQQNISERAKMMDTQEQINYSETRDAIRRMLPKLKNQHRKVLICYANDMSYQEMSDHLGLSVGWCKKLTHLAKRELKSKLTKYNLLTDKDQVKNAPGK